MKKRIYIGLFMLLGALVSVIVHGILEWTYVLHLRKDYAFWSFGFSYRDLVWVHNFLSVDLLTVGLFLGWLGGRYFWRILYVEHRYGVPRW